ncbi:hypothetical protein R6Q57_023843 [Mikania cordata]
MDNDEKLLDESSSDAVVSSVLPDASYEVKTGAELLESESGIRLMETSDHGKVSIDVIGIVNKNSELVLDKPVSDDVVSSELLNNRDFEAVNGINIEADSLGLKTETLTTKLSADQNGGHDITVQDSVDVSRVSEDEKGIVMETIEKVSDENEANDEIKEGEYIRGGDITIQDSTDDSRASKAEKDIVMENIEKVSDANEVINEEKEVEHNRGGDTVVQDSVDVLSVSGDENGVLMKVSNENEINNEEKDSEFKVTDIVWAKVKDYPWWPGQIFDPSSSTDVAKKYSNKKGLLVGYFGDQTFAWNKASKIKPFRKNFCKLEKQSNSKAFFHAVNCALDEVSRRVDFGLACSCLSKEVRDNIKSQVFVNAGIRKEASKIDGGDRFSTISTFKPVKIVQSVQELAREHFDGFNRLDFLYVRTQVLAFFRWKGYYQFQAENILDGVDNKLEDESELPLTENNKVVEDEKVLSEKSKPDVCDSDDSVPYKKERSSTNVTPKVYSSMKRSKKNISKKAIVEDEKPASVGKKNSSKKRKPDSSDSDDSVPRKKERNLTNVTPKDKSSVKGSKKNISKKATVEENIFNGNEKQDYAGKKVSSKKRKPDDCDSDDSIPHKKNRSLTNNNKTPKGNSSVKRSKKDNIKKATVEGNIFNEEKGNGIDNKNPSSPKKLFRVGDSICRIAKQISESPSILKKESQKTT